MQLLQELFRGTKSRTDSAFTGVNVDELAHQSPHVLAVARVGVDVDVSWSFFSIYTDCAGRSFMLELTPLLRLWGQELNLQSMPATTGYHV